MESDGFLDEPDGTIWDLVNRYQIMHLLRDIATKAQQKFNFSGDYDLEIA